MALRDELIRDMNAMEDGMIRTGQRTDIWQDRLVWALCKAVYDILLWISRGGKGGDHDG